MKEDTSLNDYAIPVRKSLLSQKAFLGIGEKVFMFISFITIMLTTFVSIWFLALGILLFFICKRICKNDSYLLELFFDSIFQPEILEG